MGDTNAANSSISSKEDELAELRRLILGGEPEEVLHSPLRVEEFIEVLPQALLQAGDHQEVITQSILPTVESAISASIQKDVAILSDALFPVIGPATRKSITSALGELVQSLNQTLDYSLSPRSFKWRIEAWRTGKTFAEVVLLRTLVYKVEQIFLIHKSSGLLIQHMVADDTAVNDPDLVSAMLTAIEDFVRDSFTVATNTPVDTLTVGELSVWVEEGPHTVLACVIRGNAPQSLRQTLRKAQEKIHLLYGKALETYNGDSSRFESSQAYLEDCFRSQFVSNASSASEIGSETPSTESETAAATTADEKAIAQTITDPPGKKLNRTQKLAAMSATLCLMLSIAVLCFSNIKLGYQWSHYVSELDQQPGLVVVRQAKKRGHFTLLGLRDPLAVDPNTLLTQTALDPKRVQMDWRPYLSLEPEFANQRLSSLSSQSSNQRLEQAARAELYRQSLEISSQN